MSFLLALAALPAAAVTKEEFLPVVEAALGYAPDPVRLFESEGDITKKDALRLVLEAMGWDTVIGFYDQITILPEWSDRDSLKEILRGITPVPPDVLLNDPEELYSGSYNELLAKWIASCKKSMYWKSSFSWEGTCLTLIKSGVGNPIPPHSGDPERYKDEPLFVASLSVDMTQIPCRIALATTVGASSSATLDTIAVENYGVVGGINGGYFVGTKPIGILRRQGDAGGTKFWPHRSAFGWNEAGDFVFIDGMEVANIGSERRFNKYTEMLQAGPLLLKDGAFVDNTENINLNVLLKRHPRTVVGTDGKRIIWAVIDGRDNMHSVGATIDETRRLCAQLGMLTALNLDGGGSSSLWWRGSTFTLPANREDAERPMPYAILMFAPRRSAAEAFFPR